ncbi:MAG: glycosyltransferase family 2 protein [Bdellovibrionota bacterium]
MKLSVVIPAHNEEGSITETVMLLANALGAENIPFEILVVNDHSTDGTETILLELEKKIPGLRHLNNQPPNGFGFAVRKGLESFQGDVVAVFMADASDSPADLIKFYRTLVEKKVDCVFGTRFARESKVIDYPLLKLLLNRMANFFIKTLFGYRYNDTTNAFKMYRREVIQGLRPFLSHHFNLTVELPLKAIVRGYTYAVVPNSWTNRKAGVSKLKIKEMGSRYLFIVLYCLIERWFSRGDYRKQEVSKE